MRLSDLHYIRLKTVLCVPEHVAIHSQDCLTLSVQLFICLSVHLSMYICLQIYIYIYACVRVCVQLSLYSWLYMDKCVTYLD